MSGKEGNKKALVAAAVVFGLAVAAYLGFDVSDILGFLK